MKKRKLDYQGFMARLSRQTWTDLGAGQGMGREDNRATAPLFLGFVSLKYCNQPSFSRYCAIRVVLLSKRNLVLEKRCQN